MRKKEKVLCESAHVSSPPSSKEGEREKAMRKEEAGESSLPERGKEGTGEKFAQMGKLPSSGVPEDRPGWMGVGRTIDFLST